MPLTPEDVRNKQFTTVRLREGYDEDEVDAFLDEVEAELSRLLRENDELRAKLAAATRASSAPVAAPAPQAEPTPAPAPQPVPPPPAPAPAPVAAEGAPEGALRMLQLAQRTADEAIAEARKEADRIVGEARGTAQSLERDATEKHRLAMGSLEEERARLERRVEDLRAFEREYRSRLRAYLENQLRELEGRAEAAPPAGPPRASSPSHGGGPATAPQPQLRTATSLTPASMNQSPHESGAPAQQAPSGS